MKVHFNLNAALNPHAGITVYTKEILTRLDQNANMNFEGGVCTVHKEHKACIAEFEDKMNVKQVFFPESFVFEERKARFVPVSYNKLLRSSADVFVFTGNDLPKANIKVKGKVLCVIHDLIPLYTAWDNPDRAKLFYGEKIREVHRIDRIITDSEYTKNEIADKFGFDQNKIDVIYCGVDYDRFNTVQKEEIYTECRHKYNLPQRYIFYMGSTLKYKNIEGILRSYALLKKEIRQDLKLVLANSNEDNIRLASKLKIEKDIWFLKGIDEKYKVALYQMAAMTIQISLFEGFGIPLIESMAAGTPLIASNRTCFPEVVQNAALLVEPNKHTEIALAIERIYLDDELCNNLINLGLDRAKDFSWDNAAAMMLKSINNLLDQD